MCEEEKVGIVQVPHIAFFSTLCGGGGGRAKRAAGGCCRAKRGSRREASQVVAEGDGLRVSYNTIIFCQGQQNLTVSIDPPEISSRNWQSY